MLSNWSVPYTDDKSRSKNWHNASTKEHSTCVCKLSQSMTREVFDGQVAKGYSCARKKSMATLNYAVEPALEEDLVSAMKNSRFSILIDGSNGSGLEKMNPITVRIFDIRGRTVQSKFLDMCTATAEAIIAKMNQVLSACDVYWIN